MKLSKFMIFLPAVAVAAPISASSYGTKFSKLVESVWDEFWDEDKGSFSSVDECVGGFKYPSVWEQAVAGKAIAESLNKERLNKVVKSMKLYLNGDNWFSSSTARDNDVYIDDNAQILWVLLDSYKYAGKVDDLTLSKKLMDNIIGQEVDGGGVRWKLNGDYIASISTAEAALSAVRLHSVTNDDKYLDFAKDAISWLFDNLQDSSDGLIYDGKTLGTNDVNKGKLTYSVGTMISTLAYLAQDTKERKYYDQAVKLADAALDTDGPFYRDGYWNNQLKYSHLLFVGLSDLITVYTASTQDQSSKYQKYIEELSKQADHIYNDKQVASNVFVNNVKNFEKDSDNYCDGNPIPSLMENMSTAQIFYAMEKI